MSFDDRMAAAQFERERAIAVENASLEARRRPHTEFAAFMAQFAKHAQDAGLKPQRQFDEVMGLVEVPRKIPLRRMFNGLSATVKEYQVNQVPTGVLVWDAGSSTAPDTNGPSLYAGLEASADGRLWERVARDQSSIRSKSAGSMKQSFYRYENAEQALLLLLADHIGQVRS